MQNTRTTTTDETEEILPIKATDSEASDIQKYPLDDKEHVASASNPALFATKKTKQKADLPMVFIYPSQMAMMETRD